VNGVICVPLNTQEEIEKLTAEHKLEDILGEFDVLSVIIAHELFHCVEEKNKELVTNTLKIPVKTLGLFTQKVTPLCAAEIAAFMFSKELCGINFHPRLLELIGVYPIRPDMTRGLAGRLNRVSTDQRKNIGNLQWGAELR
jgi:hypothetical protein